MVFGLPSIPSIPSVPSVPSVPSIPSIPTGIPGIPIPHSVTSRIGNAAHTLGLGSQFSELASTLGISLDVGVDPETDNGTLTESGTTTYPPVGSMDTWFSLVYVNSTDPPEYQKKAQNNMRYISMGSLLLLAVVGATYRSISK